MTASGNSSRSPPFLNLWSSSISPFSLSSVPPDVRRVSVSSAMPAAAAMRSGIGAGRVPISSPCPLIPCLDQARHHLGVARRDNACPGSNPPPPRAPPRRAALFIPSLVRSPLGRRTSPGMGRHGRRQAAAAAIHCRRGRPPEEQLPLHAPRHAERAPAHGLQVTPRLQGRNDELYGGCSCKQRLCSLNKDTWPNLQLVLKGFVSRLNSKLVLQ